MAERLPNHKFHRWLTMADKYEETWRRSNQQCFEYYDGDQWTREEQEEIESRGQQPTVINTIQPTVDMIRSIEIERRSDISVVGREGSDDGKAQLLTALLKHVFDTCNFDYYHSMAFLEALIGGRGWIECGIQSDERGRDQVKVDWIPWENVRVDPFSRKPDASDAKFIIKQKWLDLDVVKVLFPDAAEQLDSVFNDAYGDTFQGQEHEAQMQAGDRGIGCYYDTKSQRVRICECYYTVPEKKTIEVVNELTGEKTPKEVFANTIRYVIFSDEIILKGSFEKDSDNENPLGIDYYPLIPVICMRDRLGRPRGVVQGLISIQDQINKLNSKFLWTVATNRLIAEDDAMRDPDEAREEIQKPDGLVLLNSGGLGKIRVDDKYRDLGYMSNHLNFLLQTEQRISGVNDSMLGLGGANERSGVMQSTRIQQGAAMQTSILENLYFSKQRIALVVLRLIGRYYTDYRVIRITQPNGLSDEYQFNVPGVDENTGEPKLLNDIPDTLFYDVVLKKVPPFSTMRERTLMIFSEVLKSNVIPAPVAAKLMLMLSDAPNKEDLILELENFYKEQAAAAAAMPAGQ